MPAAGMWHPRRCLLLCFQPAAAPGAAPAPREHSDTSLSSPHSARRAGSSFGAAFDAGVSAGSQQCTDPPQDPLGDPQALSDTLSLHNTSLLPPLPGFAERGGRAQRAGTGKLPTSASNCSQPRARIPCAWLHRWLVPPLAMFGRMPAPLAAPQGAAATPRVGPAGRGAPMGAPMNPRMLQGMGPSLPRLDPPAPPCSIPRVLPRAGQS